MELIDYLCIFAANQFNNKVMSDDTKTGIVVLFVAGVIGLGWAYIDDKLEKARKQPKIDYSLLRKIENENPDVEAYEPPVRQQYDDEDGNDNGNNDYPDDYAYNEDYDGSYDQSSTNGRLPQADYSGMSGDDIDYHNTMRQAYTDALDQSKYPKGSYVRLTPETQKAMNRDRTCSVNGQVYIDASGNPVGGDAGGSGSTTRTSSRDMSRIKKDAKAITNAIISAEKNPTGPALSKQKNYDRNSTIKYGN